MGMKDDRAPLARPLKAVVALAALLAGAAQAQSTSTWPSAGGDLRNTRNAPAETTVGTGNAALLAEKWAFAALGDVSATPTVEGNDLYVPDWGGMLYRIDTRTGKAVWKHLVEHYTGNAKSMSRTSPAIAPSSIIVGDQASGTVLAIDKATGELLWSSLVDPQTNAIITASPVVAGNVVYVGVSSHEESAALLPTHKMSFRGSVAALDLATGKVLWRFYTVPPGYTGGAVWSSHLAVDQARGSLYISTGNNYSVPASVTACLRSASTPAAQSACLAPDDYVDAVVALNLATGQAKWGRRLEGADNWTAWCFAAQNSDTPCPNPAGPDYDFGSSPNLFTVAATGQDLVGAGQKSGIYWALNPDTGATVWATQVGPGGMAGGIQWGSAADGKRVYVALNNSGDKPYTLQPSGTAASAGSWAALDAATGRILWQVPATGKNPHNLTEGANALAAMSVANGVVYAGSMSGDMTALDAASGALLWKFASGGSVGCGPSIVNGQVYWGSGYSHLGLGTRNNKLYAFGLP